MSNGIGTLTRAICRLPGAIDSRALQLCNECPRSRGASAPLTASHGHPPGRGSGAPCLCFVFFFFSCNIPIFATRTPGWHPAPEVAAWWAVGSGSGSGSGGAAAPGRSRKTRAAVGGSGGPRRSGPGARAAGWRPPRTHAHASRGAPAPRPVPAPPRPPGEFTTPKQILTESVPFSQMMDVFSVWPPGRRGWRWGGTSRRASRDPLPGVPRGAPGAPGRRVCSQQSLRQPRGAAAGGRRQRRSRVCACVFEFASILTSLHNTFIIH